MQKSILPETQTSRNWRLVYLAVFLNTVLVIFLLWLFSNSFSA